MDMKHFILHPDAIANFNQKADGLLYLLTRIEDSPGPASFDTEQYIDHEFDEAEIIGERRHSMVDVSGQEISKYFVDKGHNIGLEGESYRLFYTLCEAIQKNRQVRDLISLKTLLNEIFEWITARYKGKTAETMIEYISPRLDLLIQENEIWIPIYSLYIETGFKLGRVSFEPMSKSLIDNWKEIAVNRIEDESQKKDVIDFYEKDRREVQGLCAGVMRILAERERASQIAYDEIECCLNVLRFFDMSNLHPKVVSHCTVYGKQNMQMTRHYYIANGTISLSVEAHVTDGYHRWTINNDELQSHFQNGLKLLDTILGTNDRTEYQKAIIDTLQIYSRGALCHNISDRLFYILVALESFLSKNTNEPIQQNIGDRMAFAISKNPVARKKIVSNFKLIYGLRSAFVHHANEIDSSDLEELRIFMLNAWLFFHSAIINSSNFRTREEFIEEIENIKYA